MKLSDFDFNLPDDLIATHAAQAKDAGYDVVIVGSDKDLFQLVQDGVTIFDPVKDRHLDAAGALLTEHVLEGVDDLGHGEIDGFDVGPREVEQLHASELRERLAAESSQAAVRVSPPDREGYAG